MPIHSCINNEEVNGKTNSQKAMPQLLAGKEILLGVSGSIAAYKAADLCSRLGKLGANIHVVLTPAAAQFVGVATFRALTRNPVVTDVFEEPTARRIAHIDLAQSVDLVLVAPASADILARMAHGLADDMLSTCLLATPPQTPLIVAPAMNTVMWEHPATIANVQILRGRGVEFIAPSYGLLACQDVGTGKLADVEDIVAAVCERLQAKPAPVPTTTPAANDSANPKPNHDADQEAGQEADYKSKSQNLMQWTGRRVLITAGATREPLDPVRFLSNRSSGKMGYAIAAEAQAQGAEVTLVSGFATAPLPAGVCIVPVQTAEEMLAACQTYFAASDVFIAAAAVADYAPETTQTQKIKKDNNESSETVTLRLKRTPDIVATLAHSKQPGQLVVGFAAETEHLLSHARAKLESKQLDLIVANDVTAEGAGFESDTNIVTLLWPDGRAESLPQMSKREVGRALLEALQGRQKTEDSRQ